MKIGISSWACPWSIGVAGHPLPENPLTAAALLDRAAAVGADVLQIADNLPVHGLPHAELQELAAAAKQHGIALEVGTRGLNPANLLRYLEIANLLGAKLVRTLPHDGADRPGYDEALSRLNAVKREYEAAGVRLAIENHDFYHSTWLKRLVETANSASIGVCLDAVNNLGLGESFKEVLNNLGCLTVNFHCKDYQISRKPTMLGFDVTGCPAGEGMLDLALAKRTLTDCSMSWVIESWLPWQGDIDTTQKVETDWLQRGVSNLKQL